ncbi:RIC1-domain-containing protein [Lentinula edodes]|uniref:RIC1-domain-containing protein n=1 Tax=Lentinula edodes TaxID=5353 RepID=A0A1Q3EPU9_LENED|nr:RIC1-domain-containing protein [Lentinula edodes]
MSSQYAQVLTRNGISIWRVRPSANLAFLSRTPISMIDHGENREAHWSPDGSRIVIKTSDSYLVLVTVIFHSNETIYQAPPLSTNAQRNFLAGPGEAFPLSSVSLQFEGVIRVEGTLIRVHQRYSEYLGQHQKESWGNEDLTQEDK